MRSMFIGCVQRPRLSAMLIAASALLVMAGPAGAQAPCEQFNQCVTGVCQADGTCQTTPKPNTAACDDNNPCTVDDHCDGAGNCVSGGSAPTTTGCDDRNDCTTGDHCDGSGKCVGGSDRDTGPCTLFGLGQCAAGTCEVFVPGFPPLCNATLKSCQDRCHFCNPSTGQCDALTVCSLDPCSTGECDPATGGCVAANEGGPCTVLGLCVNRAGSCHDAECFAGTPQPTDTPSAETPTPTVGPGTCVGDCDGSGQVTVDEILTMVNIALGNAPAMDCLAGDANFDGQITVDEILAAVNNALNGCPV